MYIGIPQHNHDTFGIDSKCCLWTTFEMNIHISIDDLCVWTNISIDSLDLFELQSTVAVAIAMIWSISYLIPNHSLFVLNFFFKCATVETVSAEKGTLFSTESYQPVSRALESRFLPKEPLGREWSHAPPKLRLSSLLLSVEMADLIRTVSIWHVLSWPH